MPAGFRPLAVAVLVTTPASTSACVIVCAAAVHVVDAPGASVVTGQDTAPAVGSVTATSCSVTVPVLLDQEGPGDLVTEVGLAVGVDVGHRGRLGQAAAPMSEPIGVVGATRGRSVTVAPAGVLRRRGRRVVDDAGVDVGSG